MISNESLATIASGSYAGDDSVNRAIPHGLGRVPKVIIIVVVDTLWLVFGTNVSRITVSQLAVTAIDNVNFYVGNATSYPNSANALGDTYTWFAL